jgi:hypothetical protein
MRLLIALLLVCSMVMAVGCNRPAKYGKCQTCGKMFGFRGGDLPGQNSVCPRCNGHIYYPPHKSGEYYEYKREYGGTED